MIEGVKITFDDNAVSMRMLKTTWKEALLVRDAYRAGELPRSEAKARLHTLYLQDRYFWVELD